MSEIINSTYNIIGKLGAGGGGIVYLAEHNRLGKKVVLKADKRNVNTRTVLLRREVDILKELRHTYIPQVYDYFIENDTSYTVMDYVDGESLDKVLKRQGRFSQPQVIHWARQLLEALSYLHSPTHGEPPRGYIHSDIKPANIMLRPNGDICLIDFNISLAIGIESVVGRSEGYSSPEHYMLDYTPGIAGANDDKTEAVGDETERVTESAPSAPAVSSSLSGSLKRVTILDARSDIYSVGATLYHLLSGKRPHKDAAGVEPLSYKDFSPPLVDIITKAMSPDPDMRFHTADEMLTAINGLWKNDRRVKRQRKRLIAVSAVMSVMFVSGALAVLAGLKQTERQQAALVLASDSSEALSRGNVRDAVDYALKALPDDPGMFDIPYTAEAQLALTNALGVYDLSDSFKPYYTAELPSAPFRIKVSPDGAKLLVFYAYELAIYELDTGKLIASKPTLTSAMCEAEFLSGGRVVYSGKDGLTAYDADNDAVIWQAAPATAVAVSGNGSLIAAVNGKDDVINFYDAETGKLVSSRSLEGRHFNIPENDNFADSDRDVFELNDSGTLCAVSLNGGFLGLLDPLNGDNDLIIYDESDNSWFDGAFVGNKFAFSSAGNSGSLFGIVDCEAAQYLGDMAGNSFFSISEHSGRLYVTQNDTVVEFDTDTFEQKERAYTENKNITAFDVSDSYAIAAADGGFSVFYGGAGLLQTDIRDNAPDFVAVTEDFAVLANRDSPSVEVLRLKKHDEKHLMDYDPEISHSEARLNAGRSSLMLFGIEGFTLVNSDGSVRMTAALPEPEKIYDQQYRRDNGEYLEVTYYSGKTLRYSADSGELISESSAPPPDDSLYEEFETENFTIKSPLHGAPAVYDKKSGRKIAELNGEDRLTYITEFSGGIAAQYISADGSVYGILMNENCEPIARVPYLCDISGDMLVCDLPSGSIKLSPVYSLGELKEMADNFWN